MLGYPTTEAEVLVYLSENDKKVMRWLGTLPKDHREFVYRVEEVEPIPEEEVLTPGEVEQLTKEFAMIDVEEYKYKYAWE